MFKKLLSNLPYNPSLIGQVSFYAKRLHSEEKIRRLGFFFVAVAFAVQSFAYIKPAEASVANSTNDIINGGFTNTDQAVLHCLNGSSDFFEILSYYGLGCDSIKAPTSSTIYIRSNAADYDSLGRNQQGSIIARTGKLTNEYPVDISGAGRFWMKDLRAWDSGAYSTYKVLSMKNKYGQTIMVMYDCGNIVTVGRYTPPAPIAPRPTPTPTNNRPSMSFTATCSLVSWRATDLDGRPRVRIYVTQSTVNSDTDWANKGPFVHSVSPTSSGTTNDGSWSIPSQYKNTSRYRVFAVVSDKLPSGQMDDTNYVRASPTTGVLFGPCTTTTPTTPEQPTDLCPDISGTQTNEAECKPCEASQTNEDATACLIFTKTARNVTQKVDNADGTTASGGDTISYTLSVKNNGKTTIKGFVIEENISDVLDYAEITDLNGAKLDGVFVRWSPTNLSPNETVHRRLSVKIKSPVPSTPISASDPGHFDLVMNNVYGNAVNIKLPGDVIKTVEITTKSLPNTGPGESIAAAFAFTVFVSYFFARSRLFAKELDIVRTDYAKSGGY